MYDKYGFTPKTYAEILSAALAKGKEKYGEDFNIGSNTQMGQAIEIIAWFAASQQEDIAKVYFGFLLNSCVGVHLDRLAANDGITRNSAAPALANLTFTGDPGFTIDEGTPFETESGTLFNLTDDVTLDDDGNGSGDAYSDDLDETANVLSETITVQSEPTPEVYTVTNPTPATGGASQESDIAFRARIKQMRNAHPGPPIEGIMTAIGNVTGVRSVYVYFNDTGGVDSYGNPANSLHIYALGGADADIYQAILNSVAFGIYTAGSHVGTINDSGGHPHRVAYDQATEVKIHAKINILTNDSFDNDSGTEDVVEAVIAYIDSLQMHGTVRASRLLKAVYDIAGIEDVTVLIGKNSDSLSEDSIKLDLNEAAATDATLIEVTTDNA